MRRTKVTTMNYGIGSPQSLNISTLFRKIILLKDTISIIGAVW